MHQLSPLRLGLWPIAVTLFFLCGRSAICQSSVTEVVHTQSTNALPNSGAQVLRLTGTVLDESGNPVSNAKISWFPNMPRFNWTQVNLENIPVAFSDTSGKFELKLASDSPILHHVQFGRLGTAVVVKPGYSIVLKSIPISRMLVEGDQTFCLHRMIDYPVQVNGSDGQPLQDTKVMPASLDGQLLPLASVESTEVTTDARGQAVCGFIQPGRVTHVYLKNDSLGLQRVPITWVAGVGQIQSLPIKRFSGRVTPVEGVKTDLTRIKLKFVVGTGTTDFSVSSVWHTNVNADGTFESLLTEGSPIICADFPEDFPYVFDFSLDNKAVDDAAGRIELRLQQAVRLLGRVVDEKTGEGVAGVIIIPAFRDNRYAVSNQQGEFSFWVQQQTKSISFLPLHPLGDYEYGDIFFRDIATVPKDGGLAIEPTPMKRRCQVVGRVVDEAGIGVANAKIKCEYKLNRFSGDTQLFSDRDGYFQFHGILPKSVVKLSARTESMGTKEPVTVRLKEDAEPRLVVVPLPSVRYAGRILDPSGKPVESAQVTVRHATVWEAESYGGENRFADNLFGYDKFYTDSAGQFLSNSTLDWKQDTSIEVRALGFENYFGSWKTRTPPETSPETSLETSSNSPSRVSFEDVVLIPAPVPREIRVQVVDERQQFIDSCRVVFLGAKSGLTKRLVAKPGEFTIQVLNSPQVAAAIADGYLPEFQLLHHLPEQPLRFQLKALSQPVPPRPIVSWSREEIRQTAGELLTLIPEPKASDSLFKKAKYYPLLALTSPSQLISTLKDGGIIGKRFEMLRGFVVELLQIPNQELMRILPELDHESKATIYLEMAKQTSDPKQRDQYLGEAAISSGQLSGNAHIAANGRLAAYLMEIGQRDMARQIIVETFNSHEELQKLAQQSQRTKNLEPVASRFFAPLYTTVDPECAFQIIEMGAYEQERDLLKIPSVAVMAATGGPWKKWVEVIGKDRFSLNYVDYYFESTKLFDTATALEFASQLPDSLGKASFLIKVAKHRAKSADALQLELVRTALPLLDLKEEYSQDHASHIAADAAVLLRDKDPQLAERMLFESLWNCEKDNRRTPFSLISELSQRLSKYDKSIAKLLIDPCFEDWSWLFEGDEDLFYSLAPPLHALCEIDSRESLSRLRQLMELHLEERPSRKYALVGGLCQMLLQRAHALPHPDRR